MNKVDLQFLREFAKFLKAKHCMFATSKVFKNLYSIKYSVWDGDMPMNMYNKMLNMYSLPHMMESAREATVERRSTTDLPDTDKYPSK